MKRMLFSIMETQHNFSRVIRALEAGHEVVVTRRRREVARLLLPARKPGPVKFPEFERRAREIWGRRQAGTASEALLEEARGER